MKPQELTLFALCLYREARGEPLLVTKQAVAWVIRNRVNNPRWWGDSYWSVILKPYQFSSFNKTDPNATKWPQENDAAWVECLSIASDIGSEVPSVSDPSGGATSYFDCSLDLNPPAWSEDGTNVKTCDYGRLHFYKLRT
jgi:spore germination cell wall hydrolase CwlJ-like protein